LKGQPAKDENKKLSIKNKTQQQPDNFDIRDFISSEEEYDSFEDAEDDPEDGEYRGRNILPASVRSQIQLLGTFLCVLPILHFTITVHRAKFETKQCSRS
jgi:hypothetical protein